MTLQYLHRVLESHFYINSFRFIMLEKKVVIILQVKEDRGFGTPAAALVFLTMMISLVIIHHTTLIVLCAANCFDLYKRCLSRRLDAQKYRIRIYSCTIRRKPLHFRLHPTTTNDDNLVYRA